MKTLVAFFAGALLTSCLAKECSAQQTTTYVNTYGQPVATIQQIGNTTFVSNQYGQPVGSATTLPTAVVVPVQLQNVLPLLPTLPMIGAPR